MNDTKMKIFINGESFTLENTSNITGNSKVSDALSAYLSEKQSQSTFAVALNGQFVSKQTYASTSLNQNDALDILFPIVGG